MVVSAALAAASLLWRSQLQQDLGMEASAYAALEQQAGVGGAPVQISASDFLGALPRSVSAQQAVDALQREARSAGVQISSITLREAGAKAEQLGRLEITLNAQGAYGGLKQMLAEWLARFPSATVRSQQWRRQDAPGAPFGGGGLIEANWVLSLWTAPVGLAVIAPRDASVQAGPEASASRPVH